MTKFRPSKELSRPRLWIVLIISGAALAIGALIASTALAASSAAEAARLSRQDGQLARANHALIKEVQTEDANLAQLLQEVKAAQRALANIGPNTDARQLADALCLIVGCAPAAAPSPQVQSPGPTPAPGNPTPATTPTPLLTPTPTVPTPPPTTPAPTIPSPLPLAPTAPAPTPPPLVTLPTLPLTFLLRFPGA